MLSRFAAAFVVAVSVVPLASGSRGTVPASEPPTISVIERNLANALAKARTTLIVRVHKHGTNTPQYVTAVEWVDLGNAQQRRLDYDGSGRLTTETSQTASGTATGPLTRTDVTVAYAPKTWSVMTSSVACGGYTGRRCPLPPDPSAACGCDLDPFTDFPTAPRVSLLGQETIDQRPTFHLRFIVTGVLRSTTDFWIDRSTYLPVRGKLVVPQTGIKGRHAHAVANDFTWLPRTPANLARFRVVIPHGFKRTPPSP